MRVLLLCAVALLGCSQCSAWMSPPIFSIQCAKLHGQKSGICLPQNQARKLGSPQLRLKVGKNLRVHMLMALTNTFTRAVFCAQHEPFSDIIRTMRTHSFFPSAQSDFLGTQAQTETAQASSLYKFIVDAPPKCGLLLTSRFSEPFR